MHSFVVCQALILVGHVYTNDSGVLTAAIWAKLPLAALKVTFLELAVGKMLGQVIMQCSHCCSILTTAAAIFQA